MMYFQKIKNVIFKIFILFLWVIITSYCKKEKEVEKVIDLFEKFEVRPGDKIVYISWKLKDISEIPEIEASDIELKKMKIYKNPSYSILPESEPYLLWKYNGFVDTEVNNGVSYTYYAILECSPVLDFDYVSRGCFDNRKEPEPIIFISYSDTITVTPNFGLPDPIPEPCKDFSYTYQGDSILLYWTPPEENDSLYYIFYSEGWDSNYKIIKEKWFYFVTPLKLRNGNFKILNFKDGKTRFYKIYVIVNDVLSKPSQILEIKHE